MNVRFWHKADIQCDEYIATGGARLFLPALKNRDQKLIPVFVRYYQER